MPINATFTYLYRPNPTVPIGFEASFKVYDATAGGGGDVLFVTSIHVDPIAIAD